MSKSKKMNKKHNKKRNTAFLYEALVRELTKSILEEDKQRKHIVISLIKEHFKRGTELFKEKEVYSTLLESHELKKEIAQKVLAETKKAHQNIDSDKLFKEQTSLIKKINKQLGSKTFNTFVPDYRSLATIAQMFSKSSSIKNRVLLEEKIVEQMCSSLEEIQKEEMKSIDNLAYKTFVNKFNEKYGNSLLEEQKTLVTNYVMSFADNGIDFKVYVNEELGRLKESVTKALQMPEINEDRDMESKAKQVLSILQDMSLKPMNEKMITQVMKVQELVNMVQESGDGS